MTNRKTICIVHYNTPELLRACLLSFMKQGTEWHFVIFDNSNQRPVTMEMLSEWELTQTDSTFGIIDNTQGQIIDFDKELAKWPSRVPVGRTLRRDLSPEGCRFLFQD